MSLADYDILRAIGRGTYGEVHLVASKKDRKQYVIKKMTLIKASARERKAAEQEAKLLSNLRHPNIVSYKDSFEHDSNLYIVMGFAEGGDLYTKLREHREKKDFLSEQQVVRWYIQICMALQYLHDRRILHRDLKTQNIFLTKTKMIKVGDLGIAKVLESSNDMATTLIGTPYYMSPELFSNRPYNHKSDVWALGCCIYEMVTLKHAFNAKDMNSLVYKILKGKMPPMPEEYSGPLCELIRNMLLQNPDKRPSVNRMLRNSFIKQHIKLFLDESSRRRPASGRSSRRTSAASNASSQPSSRKTSVNSQGSSPSPHPPSLAPDPSRITRAVRARSPVVGADVPKPMENMPKDLPQVGKHETREENVYETPINHLNGAQPGYHSVVADPYPEAKTPCKEEGSSLSSSDSTLKPTIAPAEPPPKPPLVVPSRVAKELNTNSNNSHLPGKQCDSGIYVNFAEEPKYEQVVIHQRPKQQCQSKPTTSQTNQENENPVSSRVGSASSSRSSSSTSSKRSPRPLPECPAVKTSAEPKRKALISEPRKERSDLQDSLESVTSVASSVASSVNEDGTPRLSSARQRRRERQQKQKIKTPAIVEEIRRSRNTGFKNQLPQNVAESRNVSRPKGKDKKSGGEKISDQYQLHAAGDAAFRPPRSRENSESLSSNGVEQQQQPEIEEFMTLLHTTLNLGKSDKSDADEPVSSSSSPNSMSEDADGAGGALSPVPELSESSSSSNADNFQARGPYGGNTPAATPISGPAAQRVLPHRGISKGTLRSTQRLMDRIVSLRRDCIHGLGVPLLHRAYEVLDANENEDVLQKELVTLLGPQRFELWAGKIWQLKFCEESMFGHCGTITVM